MERESKGDYSATAQAFTRTFAIKFHELENENVALSFAWLKGVFPYLPISPL